MLTKFIGQCGYMSYNITHDKSKVTCKWCKQIIKKEEKTK